MTETEVERLVVRLVGDNQHLINTFRKTEAVTDRFVRNVGRKMQRIGAVMTAAFTLPTLAAGGASIKLATDFQTSMTKIETLVGLTGEQVDQMRVQIRALSDETGKSSLELSEALFVVTSAGARGAEAMSILERSTKASAIGLGETADIARAVTSVMTAYADENMTAAQATDQFLAVVREGNLEAAQLAPSIGRVIGLASQLGVSFAEVGGSIATFTRLGVTSNEAVTGLRGILNAVIKPTDQTREALAMLGMTTGDLRKQISDRGLAGTLVELLQKFEGNDEALSMLIPSVEALSAVLGTAGAQGEDYVKIVDSIANANGLVDDGFKRTAEDSGFKFWQTVEQIKNVMKDIGNTILPAINPILQGVQAVVQWFSKLPAPIVKVVGVMAALAAAIGPVLFVIGGMIALAPAIIAGVGGAFAAVGSIIAAVSGPVLAVGAYVGMVTALFVNYMGGLDALFTKIGQTVAGVVEFIRPLFMQIWNVVSTVFGQIWGITQKVFNYMMDQFIAVHKSAFGFVIPALRFIRDMMIGVLISAEFAFGNIERIIQTVFVNAAYATVNFFEVWKYRLTVQVPAYFNWLLENWKNILTDMFNFGKMTFLNLGTNIGSIFSNIGKIIKGEIGVSELWKPLTEGFESALTELPKIPEREIGGLEMSLGIAANAANNALQKDFAEFRDKRLEELFPLDKLEPKLLKDAEDAGTTIENSIKNGIEKAKPAIEESALGSALGDRQAVDIASAEAFARVFEYRLNKPQFQKGQINNAGDVQAKLNAAAQSQGIQAQDKSMADTAKGIDDANGHLKTMTDLLRQNLNNNGVPIVPANLGGLA